MATLVGEEKSALPVGCYSPFSSGFLVDGECCWVSCRVSFHRDYFRELKRSKYTQRNFTYTLNNGQSLTDVLNVLTEVENRLNLAEDDRLKLTSDVKFSQVFSVDPGVWWIDPVRFTLLTIFLREAKTNLAESVKVNKNGKSYLWLTKKAVESFLNGNIFYRGEKFIGWVESFSTDGGSVLLSKEPPAFDFLSCCHHAGWPFEEIPLVKR